MPVVGIPVDMLLSRIGSQLTREQLVEHLQHLGCDVEGYATVQRFRCGRCENILEITASENAPVVCDRCAADFRQDEQLLQARGERDVLRMELLAVRPDMFDPGGLARVLRHYLGETGDPASYEMAAAQLSVAVDSRLARSDSYWPRIACAVVRSVSLSDDLIKTIMKLQENLHWALCRDRKLASIGVYDLDRCQGQCFRYRAVEPDGSRFVPLGCAMDATLNEMTPRRILQEHPKGIAYAHLLADFCAYPLLEDEIGTVLSMPPIINSEETRVTQASRNFFVDVTGLDDRLVDRTLNILATAIVELDANAILEQVRIEYEAESRLTPDLSPQVVTLDPRDAERLIGTPLSPEDTVTYLARMGHGSSFKAGEAPRGSRSTQPVLEVSVPAYRNDVMHPVDLIEDVAIAYGYHKIAPLLVPSMTVGQSLPLEEAMEHARQALCGMGYSETVSLILSSPEQQFAALGLAETDDFVLIDNPISTEQTMVRVSLLPGLLDTLSANTDQPLPQRIFEVGRRCLLDQDSETGAREDCLVAGAAVGARVDFAQVRSACEGFLRELDCQLEMSAVELPQFIAGRAAAVLAVRGGQRQRVGVAGEVHPAVLERFRLFHPAAAFELNLEALLQPGAI